MAVGEHAVVSSLTKAGYQLRRIRGGIRTVRLCKNWREIIGAHARGKPCSRFVFRNGIDLRCSWSDPSNITIFDEIFLKRHYSQHFDVEPGDVVVDVGGNVGMFLAYAVHRKCARVVIAEPFGENAEAIQDNISRNGLRHAVLAKVAVSDGPGNVQLWIDPDDSGGHSITDGESSGRAEYEEVPTLSLRELLESQEIEVIDFLKVDCEGAEGMIFESLTPDDLSRIRKIAIEFHDDDSSLSHSQLDALLREAGFTTWVEADTDSAQGYIWAARDETLPITDGRSIANRSETAEPSRSE